MKVFFDTNVLLNGPFNEPGGQASDQCITLCSNGLHAGWIAWHTLSNAHYIVRARSKSKSTALQFITDLLAWAEVAETAKPDALAAIGSGMPDFEDALQAAAALACGADLILTRNLADFKNSTVPAMTPGDFLSRLAATPAR